ncbi:MAG: hypothetical protein EBU88_07655 [Acidobacteria bacterium]|nr:hypothetical protein [Acidobacteriota bacterium]
MNYCQCALDRALHAGLPEIFNSDHGSQFKSNAITGILKERGIKISTDGRGRALENVFVDWLWRCGKYEEVYLNDHQTVPQAIEGLGRYFNWGFRVSCG